MALTIPPLPSAWPPVSQLSQQIAVVTRSSFQYLVSFHPSCRAVCCPTTEVINAVYSLIIT